MPKPHVRQSRTAQDADRQSGQHFDVSHHAGRQNEPADERERTNTEPNPSHADGVATECPPHAPDESPGEEGRDEHRGSESRIGGHLSVPRQRFALIISATVRVA